MLVNIPFRIEWKGPEKSQAVSMMISQPQGPRGSEIFFE